MERREWTKKTLDSLTPELLKIHQEIWTYAEPSSAEVKSAKLLCEVLRQKGFTVEEGVCGRPTAFVATYGEGHPIVGYLGEYDALPGLSQQAGLPGTARFQRMVMATAAGTAHWAPRRLPRHCLPSNTCKPAACRAR